MTGTYYHNYKGFYSIVLLAICDSNYCFTLFDLGHYGTSNNDSCVFAKSKIGEMTKARALDIPVTSTYMACDFDPLLYSISWLETKYVPLRLDLWELILVS